ncbi:hypothetical protein [Bowmanella yangjiangensis]|uniref:Uncharacterized protein n=1 Tax=Bowmanella yangjiangensis TaxID=2811230 RepID=A0ABS3CVZ3_9ALTE|nr:hypothetical protein [Bowmanella yangjiangensis]MBN7821292.1 hypothetical protein [Bowmanella yangjiangensis]
MELKLDGKGLGITIPILLTIIGGAFYLGLSINSARVDHLKDIVKEYERSTQLDAPNLVSSINQSAKALKLSSSERKAFDVARERVDEYASRVGTCEAKLENSNSKVIELTEGLANSKSICESNIQILKNELNSFLAESSILTAKGATAVELIPNQVMLGVQSLYDGRAVVSINGETVFIDLGGKYRISSSNNNCNMWLTRIDRVEKEADFKLACIR